MASTTFVDGNTVIYASWLNDINGLAYLGNFPASDVTISGTLSVPVLKSSAATMTIGTVAGGGTVNIESNGTTVASITSAGTAFTGTLTKNGNAVASSDGGTYTMNITGNAATASNGGVTSVNGQTGAVSITTQTQEAIYNNPISTNTTYTFSAPPNSRPIIISINYAGNQGGNTNISLNFQWGLNGLTNTYNAISNVSVNYQVFPCPSLVTTIIGNGTGGTIYIRINSSNLGNESAYLTITQI